MTDLLKLPQPGQPLESSAPGRICLFGEHQDYLGLPVIAAALNLRIRVRAFPISQQILRVHLPDIGEEDEISLVSETPYAHERDYLRAAVNILLRSGTQWPCGYEVTVRSDIPVNSGASSSSALQVAWCAFLLAAAGDPRAQDPTAIARLAYESEVLEFRAPGGMMDHFSSALGGVIWLDTTPPFEYRRLCPKIGEFVLVDSGIPKDTNGILGQRRAALEKLGFDFAQWKQQGFPPAKHLASRYSGDNRALFEGTISNALLTAAAREFLVCPPPVDQRELGRLLDKHHDNLSRLIGVSHPAIDDYLDAARRAGAYGGKINGSGCGGSFFVLTPGEGERFVELFHSKGLRAWIVRPAEGVKVSPLLPGVPFQEIML